jgi:hypothetical protein
MCWHTRHSLTTVQTGIASQRLSILTTMKTLTKLVCKASMLLLAYSWKPSNHPLARSCNVSFPRSPLDLNVTASQLRIGCLNTAGMAQPVSITSPRRLPTDRQRKYRQLSSSDVATFIVLIAHNSYRGRRLSFAGLTIWIC